MDPSILVFLPARVYNTSLHAPDPMDHRYNIALSNITDFEKFKKDDKYVDECTKSLEVTTNNLALNTKGALCAYIRYNPEFTNPTSGIFLSKSGDDFDFLVPTDFSIYEADMHIPSHKL